jgi:hypothetical protein
MAPLVWLLAAVVAGVAAAAIGWPAWQSYRRREARDDNAERYLAWRGRADRTPRASTREGMTGEERRRISIGVTLAIAAVAALIAFFATS